MISRIKEALLGAFLTFVLLPSLIVADDLKQMISPMSHPTNFEDPRHITELRPIFIYHKIDNEFATAGGDVRIYALQARFKVADNFSIIATKDGYVDFNPETLLEEGEGFANIGLGGKYSPIVTDRYILTTGLRYELPIGETEVLQGHGDGLVNPFVSGGYTLNNWNFIVGTGLRLAIDNTDTSFYDLDTHISYKAGDFYPFLELGLIHVLDSGDRLPIVDEGQDFFNLGSSQSDGETITTMSVGTRYRISESLDLGLSYQIPVNNSSGTRVLDYRITSDLIYRFSLS